DPARAFASCPTRRSSDLAAEIDCERAELLRLAAQADALAGVARNDGSAKIMAENLEAFFEAPAVVLSTVDRSAVDTILQAATARSEEHTSELQSRENLVC